MKFVFATKIIATDGNVENAEALLCEKRLQIGLKEKNLVRMKGKASIILDFGKELSGGARILVSGISGKKDVRLRFGESVGEVCADLGEKNATNDHAVRDMTVTLTGLSDMTFGQTGFRFLRIDTLHRNTHLDLKTVAAAVDTHTRPEDGTFVCDDEAVNTIWSTAAYTLRLCMHNGYLWDGVKRDRLVWIGDLYPEMRAAHCLYRDVPEVLHSLDFAWEETPLPDWMAGMPSYSVWWLWILSETYMRDGEKEKYRKYIPYVHDLLEQIGKHIKKNGAVDYGSNFIDWPSNYVRGGDIAKKHDCLAGVAYLTKLSLEKTKVFLLENGEPTDLCEKLLLRLANGSFEVRKYKQVAGLGVLAGDRSENNKDVLLRNGAHGLSTFMSYFILSAVAAYGEYDTALQMMKEYYGGMLSVGATTFWEDFDIDWLRNAGRLDALPENGKSDIHGDNGAFCYVGFRHSLCHGWSSGVIPYLVETVAGVRFIGTGMKKAEITPHLSGLKYVKLTVPTVHGNMTVTHNLLENGKVQTQVDAPPCIEVIVKNEQ